MFIINDKPTVTCHQLVLKRSVCQSRFFSPQVMKLCCNWVRQEKRETWIKKEFFSRAKQYPQSFFWLINEINHSCILQVCKLRMMIWKWMWSLQFSCESASLPSERMGVQAWARRTTRVLKKTLLRSWRLWFSFKMIASLGGDVKPLALPPLSFMLLSIEGAVKRSHTVWKEWGTFPWWCRLPCTHHSYHGWAGYS